VAKSKIVSCGTTALEGWEALPVPAAALVAATVNV